MRLTRTPARWRISVQSSGVKSADAGGEGAHVDDELVGEFGGVVGPAGCVGEFGDDDQPPGGEGVDVAFHAGVKDGASQYPWRSSRRSWWMSSWARVQRVSAWVRPGQSRMMPLP